MFRKDYVMRMIEEFVRVLAKIVLLRQQKNYTDARTELDGLSRLVTGFSLEHLRSLGADGINYVFAMNMDSYAEKIFCSAKMLKEEALILKSQNRIDESKESLLIAKELFRRASEMDLEEKEEAFNEFKELNNKI